MYTVDSFIWLRICCVREQVDKYESLPYELEPGVPFKMSGDCQTDSLKD